MPEYEDTRTKEGQQATSISAACSETKKTGKLCFYESWSGSAGGFILSRDRIYSNALRHELSTGHGVTITIKP